MPIITLTTDFSGRDGYVGAVKGVISRIAPSATIVDIAHDVPRGDVAHAAWVVATSSLEFPHETIHVVVVDPGVGGTRHGVIARVPVAPPRGVQLYVGPDNGVFAHLPTDKAWLIDLDPIRDHVRSVSPTFHGRDVFAPAAAALSRGWLQVYGKQVALAGRLPWGARSPGSGHVVHVDHYGNLISNLPASEAGGMVQIGTLQLPIVRTYEDVPAGEPLAYVGSAGTIEVAVRDRRADQQLGMARGDTVRSARGDQEGPYR